ncbi:hypothetical protein BJ742DRAFT_852150 [Cladochytrium replicatum]|nr:hypothetical protein BJ742DRAFT_852150 [Cladochytrium replicatum]
MFRRGGTGTHRAPEEAAEIFKHWLASLGSTACPRIPPYEAETVANIILEMKHLIVELLRLYSHRVASIPACPNEEPNISSNTTAQQQTHIHPHDQRFLQEHRKLIGDYKEHFLDNAVGAALVPPKDAYITVRVLRDVGQIVLSDGSVVTMMKGTQRYVKRSDVES